MIGLMASAYLALTRYQAPDYRFGVYAGESHCQGTGSEGERRNVGGLLPCSPAVLIGAACLDLCSQLLPRGPSATATVLLGFEETLPLLAPPGPGC